MVAEMTRNRGRASMREVGNQPKAPPTPGAEEQANEQTEEQKLRGAFKEQLSALRVKQMSSVGTVAMTAAIEACRTVLGRYPKYVSLKADVDPQTGAIVTVKVTPEKSMKAYTNKKGIKVAERIVPAKTENTFRVRIVAKKAPTI